MLMMRRRALSIIIALGLASTLPAGAQTTEPAASAASPATAAAGAAASINPYTSAFTAVSAIAGAIDSANRQAWQKETSRKLDDILKLQKSIIDDLQKLRVDIKQIVTEQFASFVDANLRADISEFELNTPQAANFEGLDPARKSQILANESKLENDIQVLTSYGPGTYNEAFAGELVLAELYKFIGEKNRRELFFAKQAVVFKNWLEPSSGYPAFILSQDTAAMRSDEVVIENYKKARVPYVGMTIPDAIQGSLGNGFKVGYQCKVKASLCVQISFAVAMSIGPIQKANLDYIQNKPNADRLNVILGQISRYQYALEAWSRPVPGDSGL